MRTYGADVGLVGKVGGLLYKTYILNSPALPTGLAIALGLRRRHQPQGKWDGYCDQANNVGKMRRARRS